MCNVQFFKLPSDKQFLSTHRTGKKGEMVLHKPHTLVVNGYTVTLYSNSIFS